MPTMPLIPHRMRREEQTTRPKACMLMVLTVAMVWVGLMVLTVSMVRVGLMVLRVLTVSMVRVRLMRLTVLVRK